MSEENKQSRKKINSELEANINKKIDQMQETENEESQEIDFTDLADVDVSGGIWRIGYKTTVQ